MKVKRMKDMSKLEQELMQMIFRDVAKIPSDNVWRTYTNNFTYENENYIVKCSFKQDNDYLTYRDLVITKPQKVIDLQ